MAMESKNESGYGPIAFAIMVAALLFSGAFYFAPKGVLEATVVNTQNDMRNTISVSAEAIREVAPDKAEITFSVVSKGKDAALVQTENDAKLRIIRDALKNMGIPGENIKTVGYSLDPWREWNKNESKYNELGYVLTNSLRVVTYDVEQAGGIIKKAVENGANDVSGINFLLSDTESQKVRGELLMDAASQAKGKAEAMATAAGVSIKGLNYMSEGYSYVEQTANYKYSPVAMDAAGGYAESDVSVSAGLVRVRANVNAVYEIAG